MPHTTANEVALRRAWFYRGGAQMAVFVPVALMLTSAEERAHWFQCTSIAIAGSYLVTFISGEVREISITARLERSTYDLRLSEDVSFYLGVLTAVSTVLCAKLGGHFKWAVLSSLLSGGCHVYLLPAITSDARALPEMFHRANRFLYGASFGVCGVFVYSLVNYIHGDDAEKTRVVGSGLAGVVGVVLGLIYALYQIRQTGMRNRHRLMYFGLADDREQLTAWQQGEALGLTARGDTLPQTLGAAFVVFLTMALGMESPWLAGLAVMSLVAGMYSAIVDPALNDTPRLAR